MKVIVLVLLVTCELCWTIRVPVIWNESASEVKQDIKTDDKPVENFHPEYVSRETFHSQDASSELQPQNEKPIPVEYFEYKAKKPQFAVDVAAFHGVQSPENHYKAYPIRPFTGTTKPELGKHHLLDSRNSLHKPFQDYTKINENQDHVSPVSLSYDVFHPYEAETPALQEIYKDPVLTKIKSDLENSKNRLQQYEKDAGKPDISSEEYLESPQNTDGKLFPHQYKPSRFEIHRPQRRPIYYRHVPVYKSREHFLNQKLRHPWNHNIAKVRPMHYRPIKNHIQMLRQNHALKYDDERNEYPQVQILENYSDPKDGYDIYEKGRDKYVQLRNNVDESINKAVKENRPVAYQKLEMQNSNPPSDDEDDGEEFIPIKNYAQVRKTETFQHLPRSAALEDAETYDEIKNAPRLREAVKSTKAQTVYSEEGYEDAAYDHAGEQKHASENEGHGGFLKEYELSGGKYKTPSVSANYQDGNGSAYRDQNLHAAKWKDDNIDTQEESVDEDFTENEHEHLLEADNHQTDSLEEEIHRNKRENSVNNETLSSFVSKSNDSEEINTPYEVKTQKNSFEIPQIDLNSTFFKVKDYLLIKDKPRKDTVKQKYPYYYRSLKSLSENSPLRYAENLKFIPKKSKGGTEFYDSRSTFECPEVDDVPDPIPEKLKGEGHPDKNDDQNSENEPSTKDDNFDTTKKQPRLKGLGDKIDCFKAKYFGENPLDSPFFKEDTISNPEPLFLPNIAAYKLKTPILFNEGVENASKSKLNHDFKKLHQNNTSDLFELIEKLRNDQNILKKTKDESDKEFASSFDLRNESKFNNSQLLSQSSAYDDIIDNIKNSFNNTPQSYVPVNQGLVDSNQTVLTNKTYIFFQNKEDITKSPISRKKRGTPFVYEPYKIIRDGQIQDDAKKNVATNNVSHLIRQLQSSKIVDRVPKLSAQDTQHVKRNINSRSYTDIGRQDREINYGSSKNDKSIDDSEIIDVSKDKRRGEPRYEIKHSNHKSKYTPVTNTKSMSKEDYEEQLQSENVLSAHHNLSKSIRHKRPTNFQNTEAATSKYVMSTVLTTTSTLKPKLLDLDTREEHDEVNDSDEDYEEYEDEDEEEVKEKLISSTTTTTTTPKPAFRRKLRPQTTTQEPHPFTKEPKLKLVTRFRDYKPDDMYEKEFNLKHKDEEKIIKPTKQKPEAYVETIAPKFREKKKKVSKSTLVTDTKRYGGTSDDNDQMLKDEVDALIGVKHNMDEYMPQYEKHAENKSKQKTMGEKVSKGGTVNNHKKDDGSEEDETNDRIDDEDHIIDDDEEDDDDDDDDEEDDNDDEDSDVEDDDDDDNDDDDSDDEDEDVENSSDSVDDHEDHKENDNHSRKSYEKVKTLIITTPEPTKRSLVVTTDAPLPTIASNNAKIQEKPVITRKKIEYHKELPVNKSSPHITQFKQDIKEIEIIKESRHPLKRKPNKNVELLEFYKDDNLAKDVNKLGVEIFKENLDLRKGPKHGGNYRSAETSTTELPNEEIQNIKDAETSQSEYKKQIEVDVQSKGELKSVRGRNSRSRGKNSKLVELSDTPDRSMHGGNFKYRGKSRYNNPKSQKLIELDDHHDDGSSRDSHEDRSYKNSRGNERPMHGGNYRSEKLVQTKIEASATEASKSLPKEARQNAAQILNSFVQAVPVLTTTPGYILDPSKRMYYYLDV